MKDNPWRSFSMTWKISISAGAVHVYQSPRGLWAKEFGMPWGEWEFTTKTHAMKKARQLAARYGLRVLSE